MYDFPNHTKVPIKIYSVDIETDDMGLSKQVRTQYSPFKACVLPAVYMKGKETLERSGDLALQDRKYVFIDKKHIFVKINDEVEIDGLIYDVKEVREFNQVTRHEYKRLYCWRKEFERRPV